MKRIDKETGKSYYKKTRNSGIPFPYIVVKNKANITNSYDLYREIAINKKGYWLDFAQYHVFQNNLVPNLPMSEQLALYLLGISPATKSQILTILTELKYNPFSDTIPFEVFPDNLQKYLYKRKELIINLHQYLISNIIIEKNVLIIPIEKELSNIETEIFKYWGINIFLLFNNNFCTISFNETQQKIYEIRGKKIKINNIFNILKEYDNNWLMKDKIIINHKNKQEFEDILTTIKNCIF